MTNAYSFTSPNLPCWKSNETPVHIEDIIKACPAINTIFTLASCCICQRNILLLGCCSESRQELIMIF